MLNHLRNFMRGRYGMDQLNMALLIFGLFLSFLFRLIAFPYLYLLVYLPFGIALYRILSFHITKRSAENVKFLNLYYRLKTKIKTRKRHHGYSSHASNSSFSSGSLYVFTHCPHCRQPIRLPKSKGKIQVTCPACHAKFDQFT